MYNYTKSQRKAWWANLSEEEKIAYIRKREHENEADLNKSKVVYKPLTEQQRRTINNNMRRIGMERFIVLPD